MFGTVSEEIEVQAAASEVWKIYGTLFLAEFVVEHLPQILHKVDVLEGDGGAGTLLQITFPPGNPGFSSNKEKFIVVDDEKRVKVVEVVEDGYLNLGIETYRVRFEIIEKQKDGEELGIAHEDSCITKATIEYQTQDLAAAGIAVNSIHIFLTIMKTVADYMTKSQNND